MRQPLQAHLYKKATYQIFNFHPVHVFLNSEDNLDAYSRMKAASSGNLQDRSWKEAEPFVQKGDAGVKDFLLFLLRTVPRERFVKASFLPQRLGFSGND